MSMFKLARLRDVQSLKPLPKSTEREVKEFIKTTSTIRLPPGPGWKINNKDDSIGQGFVFIKNVDDSPDHYFGVLSCVKDRNHKNPIRDANQDPVTVYHGVMVDNNPTMPDYDFLLPDLTKTDSLLTLTPPDSVLMYVPQEIVYQIAQFGVESVDESLGVYIDSKVHQDPLARYKEMMKLKAELRQKKILGYRPTRFSARNKQRKAAEAAERRDPDYKDESDGAFISFHYFITIFYLYLSGLIPVLYPFLIYYRTTKLELL